MAGGVLGVYSVSSSVNTRDCFSFGGTLPGCRKRLKKTRRQLDDPRTQRGSNSGSEPFFGHVSCYSPPPPHHRVAPLPRSFRVLEAFVSSKLSQNKQHPRSRRGVKRRLIAIWDRPIGNSQKKKKKNGKLKQRSRNVQIIPNSRRRRKKT